MYIELLTQSFWNWAISKKVPLYSQGTRLKLFKRKMEKKSTENIDKKLLFDVHRTDKISKNSKEESYKLSNYKN